jgi:hypothetical protein
VVAHERQAAEPVPLVERAGRRVAVVPAVPMTASGTPRCPHSGHRPFQQPVGRRLGVSLGTGPGAAGSSYSHSMVPGGLLVTSSTTRLTSATSLVIRVEIRASTS